ncbi:MAG: aminotransferase class I/II-fold pyridoxal phosphate-dependent enzyme, partial [Rhodobacter sp.]|nr:aminotransferase class I/II-fold pyridoxal phosphate-dependent enzyme [Rhodobacter sp.]
TEMQETSKILRTDTVALFERLREGNILLQEVLTGAHDNLNSLERALVTRVADFVSAMNDVTSRNGVATQTLEDQLTVFNSKTGKALEDLGALSSQFETHGKALIEARDNVVMTRTFSKAYGLGGLRIGWGYGPQAIIDVLNRIRGPFNLSTAQLDVAEAAVRDQDHVARCRAENTRMRAWLAESLAEMGVPSDTSTANFVLARFADAAEAANCDAYLKTQGLIVRQVGSYKLPHCLRITVGDESSCRRIVHAVAQFKGQR